MRHLLRWAAALALGAGIAAAPAAAQKRVFDVPANAGWKEPETGVILHRTLAGLPRKEIGDFGQSGLDIYARYLDDSTEITVYLFRPALQNVAIWFDRAETQVMARDIFASPMPVAPALAFAPPKSATASALRRAYVPGKGPVKSTGIVMMPIGKWLVGIRMSSMTIGPAELDARIDQAIAGIGWPEGVADSPAVAAVEPCAAPLDYDRRAKMQKPEMADILLGAVMPKVIAEAKAKGEVKAGSAEPLCRDLPAKREYAVYRTPDATNVYVMALGDAGRAANVGPGISIGDKKSAPSFSVTFSDINGTTSVYPSFDKLPHPDQVLKLISTQSPLSSTSGNNVSINMPAK